MHEDYGYDPELAEELSDICHDECCGVALDIGILLAMAVRHHYEIRPYLTSDED
jgi:hypothetical protein